MKPNFYLLTSLLSAGLLLSAPDTAQAQLAGVDASDFRRIEQPIETKAAITAVGLGLVGLELWWFLLSKADAERRQKVVLLNPDVTEPPIFRGKPSLTREQPQSYRERLTTSISSMYENIQMPKGVILVEDRMHPQFSAG